MSDSILTGTKKVLGIAEDYEYFDPDILLHINSVFSTLTQLGVGPPDGFRIEDKSTLWVAYTDSDNRLNAAKTYVYLRVRLLFDPPTSSFAVASMKEQIKELEWRLNTAIEYPGTPSIDEDLLPGVIDGGDA